MLAPGAALSIPAVPPRPAPVYPAAVAPAPAPATIVPNVPPRPSTEPVQVSATEDVAALSIEQLANVPVTSVSRRAEPLSQAPAAVFVITREDIRRSGATSIPEILRLAPNLQVARLGANTYAISARGFNHQTGTADKLLVMIDGRTVYSPLFSGVFWDTQNVAIADIDRIEVVSGPGGALWGANAVNGVINIVTRNAERTQGLLADVNYGTLDSDLTLRYGGKLGANAAYRIYGLGFERGHTDRQNGSNAGDGWHLGQGGFRADWAAGEDALTFQGDYYGAASKDLAGEVAQPVEHGGNVLANWSRDFAGGASFKAQAYFDRASRVVSSGLRSVVNTYDADAQFAFAPVWGNLLVAGGGYRVDIDKFIAQPGSSFLDPAKRELDLGNLFVEDEIALAQKLKLTLGMKVEHNDYTGFEYMPDVRLAWQPANDHLLWAAVSRSVRTPSRVDHDLINPGILDGGPDFQSEDVLAYEAGDRGRPLSDLTLSLSLYYNVYTNLRSIEASVPGPLPFTIENKMRGTTYGAEMWGTYALESWWHLNFGASTLHKDLKLDPDSHDPLGPLYAGNDPNFQYSLGSSVDLGRAVAFDLDLRHVAKLPSPVVPAYTELGARIGWRLSGHVEVSVTGSNLLHDRHLEFVNGSLPPLDVRRAVEFGLRWEL